VKTAVHATSGAAHDGVSDRQVGDPVSVTVAVPADRPVTVQDRLPLPSSEKSWLTVTASPSTSGPAQSYDAGRDTVAVPSTSRATRAPSSPSRRLGTGSGSDVADGFGLGLGSMTGSLVPSAHPPSTARSSAAAAARARPGILAMPDGKPGRVHHGNVRSADGGTWARFVLWALVGAGACLAVLGALSIGVFVAPVVAVAAWLLVRRTGVDRSLAGAVSGVSVMLFYVALLNREGPGVVCHSTGDVTECAERWSPWPWLAIGVVLLVAGITVFSLGGRRTGH
jgi:hypothetical protein